MKKDVYEIVTERIIEKLEAGVIPWQKTWKGGANGVPKNLISNKPYRGMNVFFLGMQGYNSPYWASFKQIQKAGGTIIKGQKASLAVFWKWVNGSGKIDPETGDKVEKTFPILRYYNVWNTDQCTGISHKRVKEMQEAGEADLNEFDPIDVCEEIVAGMPKCPEIQHVENRAFYRPSQDLVNMPDPERFPVPAEYYSTLFHELVHSTGHETRLSRRTSDRPIHHGDKEYSQEELVAEMGATYLCAVTGIDHDTIDNSASYIDNWLKVLRDQKNKKLLVMAGAQAQKAADYIRGIEFENNC